MARGQKVHALNSPRKQRVQSIVTIALAQRLHSGALTAAAVHNPPADPDLALVERFQAGERRAFDELVRRYQRPLYYLALRYLKNEADAKDVTQRAFVRVFKSLGKFRRAASFRTWAYRITINLCLNHIRDNRREHVSELPEDALTTEAEAEHQVIHNQRATLVHNAISSLPPKQRIVLELRVYDDLSFKEVAELANCSENAAKVNFHHAVKRLRAMLSGVESEEEGT